MPQDLMIAEKNVSECDLVNKLIYPSHRDLVKPTNESILDEISILENDIASIDRLISIKENQISSNQNYFLKT